MNLIKNLIARNSINKNGFYNVIEHILIILSISSIFTYIYTPNPYVNSIYISFVTILSSIYFFFLKKDIKISLLTILLFAMLCLFFYSSYNQTILEYKELKLYSIIVMFLFFHFSSILFSEYKNKSIKLILIAILVFNILFLIKLSVSGEYILIIEQYFGNTGIYAIFLSFSAIIFHNYSRLINFPNSVLITILIMIIIVPLIIFLESRSACILLLLYASIYSLKHIKNKYNKTILVILSLLIIISLSFFLKKESNQGRFFILKTSALIIKDYPLLGIGYDKFASIYPLYQAKMYTNNNMNEKEIYLADNTNIALNEYVQIASELGLLGITIFLSIISVLIYYEKNNKDVYICILVAMLFAYILHSLIIANLLLIVLSLTHIPPVIKINKAATFLILNIAVILSLHNINNCYNKCAYTKLVNHLWKQSPQDINNLYMQHKKYLCDDAKLLLLLAQYNYTHGNIEMSLTLLQELDKLIRRNEIELLKSKCYVKINNFCKAEKHLLLSIAICPNRFINRYELFKLYQHQRKRKLANKIAKEISLLEEKVPSIHTFIIKKEIHKYLQGEDEKCIKIQTNIIKE